VRGLLSCSHGGEDVSETSLLLVEERSERDDDHEGDGCEDGGMQYREARKGFLRGRLELSQMFQEYCKIHY